MLCFALRFVGVELLAKKNKPISLESVSFLLFLNDFSFDVNLVLALAFVTDVVFWSANESTDTVALLRNNFDLLFNLELLTSSYVREQRLLFYVLEPSVSHCEVFILALWRSWPCRLIIGKFLHIRFDTVNGEAFSCVLEGVLLERSNSPHSWRSKLFLLCDWLRHNACSVDRDARLG